MCSVSFYVLITCLPLSKLTFLLKVAAYQQILQKGTSQEVQCYKDIWIKALPLTCRVHVDWSAECLLYTRTHT